MKWKLSPVTGVWLSAWGKCTDPAHQIRVRRPEQRRNKAPQTVETTCQLGEMTVQRAELTMQQVEMTCIAREITRTAAAIGVQTLKMTCTAA